MSLLPQPPEQRTEAAVWQDLEFGSYRADLPVWEELARQTGSPVLELGAGSGRVALHLAGEGFEVVALERDRELAEELRTRAEGLPLEVLAGDLVSLDRDGPDADSVRLAIGPLQVIQLLDEEQRRAALSGLATVLATGGRCALTLVDEPTLVKLGVAATAPPDMRDVEGWVYSSEPLWVQVADDVLRIRRLRKRVAPDGDMVRTVHDDVLHRLTPERLEAEAGPAGLRPVEQRRIPAGPYEAGSISVVLGRE